MVNWATQLLLKTQRWKPCSEGPSTTLLSKVVGKLLVILLVVYVFILLVVYVFILLVVCFYFTCCLCFYFTCFFTCCLC